MLMHLYLVFLQLSNKVNDSEEKSTGDEENKEMIEPKLTQDQIFLDMESLLDEEIAQKVQKLLISNGKDPSFVDVKPEDDKVKRKAIHEFFKNHFGDKLNTETKEKAIRISMHTFKTKNDSRNKRKEDWESLGGPYCQFVLYKEKRDTMEAINFLCKALKVHSKVLSYAGTKDHRSVSVQKVTANKVKAEKFVELNPRLRDMKLGNFTYVKEGLKLGDLKGNHFVITLRDVKVDSESTIVRAMNVLKDRGFINYFGLQRFGTSSIATYNIGRALLQNNWEEAVDLILKPRPGDRPDQQKARQCWEQDHDAKKALELFPKRCIAECNILSSFIKNGHNKDCAGAFLTLPRNLRLMYVHAYQSYIWNKMVSERIKYFGCDKPVIGDLVVLDDSDQSYSIDAEDLDDDSIHIEDKKELKVKILIEEDLPNYTIHDVVLPLPGHSVLYPNNDISQKYKELMWIDRLDPRAMKRDIKDFSLPGDYRKIMGKPKHVSWQLFRYNDPNVPLSLTDLDILQGNSEPESIPDGEYLALRINISLSTSQYATMALRELLKNSANAEFTVASSS
ncbi:hypothetical protein Glove_140g75 [Diversispora epigaea]|uniref:TRUD domain-containing protein n=1 Tax=Diversispora epigaea TaxID=1348612 RepID=A0A397IZ20_9GLOM|nr:hypothetical protein Glove_140g75 [Diversispora epigaea]